MKRSIAGLSVAVSVMLVTATVGRADDRILVRARIADHDARLAIDTGTEGPFLVWEELAPKLGLHYKPAPDNAKAPPGQIVASLSEPAPLTIFGQTFPDVRFHLAPRPSHVEDDADGLVGWRAIRGNIVVLKIAERSANLVGRIPKDVESWTRLPVRKDAGVLVLELPDGGQLLVDSGFEGGVKLSPLRWKQWRDTHKKAPYTLSAFATLDMRVTVGEECWSQDRLFDALPLDGVVVTQASAFEMAVLGDAFAGTIGLQALRRMDLVIDANSGIAYARARPEAPQLVPHNRLGAVFVPRDAGTDDLFATVVPGSPAALAGIVDGDVLLAIDGKSVLGWRTSRVSFARTFERRAGITLKLTIRRGERTFTVKAKLRDLLDSER